MRETVVVPEGTFARDRMELLADVLRRVEAEDLPFDMEMWAADPFNPYDCGTAACAGGWLARDPRAQAQGLCLSHRGIPTYAGIGLPFMALAAFLETDTDISQWLFSNLSYSRRIVTADRVLDRVEMLLERED